MAKEVPFFKFYTSEWNDGDISLEKFDLQGLFISVCSYYWAKDCDVSMLNIKKKYKGHEKKIEQLINIDCIKINGDNISISFLNEQFYSKEVQKAKNRENGKSGGRPPKKQNQNETEQKPSGLILGYENETHIDKRKEDKIIEDIIELFPKTKVSGDSVYKDCIEIYNQFILIKTDVGAKINAKEGAAMKKIIAYLKTQVKNKDDFQIEVPRAFQYIFTHFDRWTLFHKDQLNLSQIESNLINILNSIRNGKSTQQPTKQSKYTPRR